MVSTNQQGTKSDYQTDADRHIAEWDNKTLLKLVPMTQKVALRYWNAANRQDAKDRVKDHFQEQLQKYR